MLHKIGGAEESPKSTKGAAVLDNPLKLFQTRIGSNTTVVRCPDLNDSLSERIDLHMCNRGGAAQPPVTATSTQPLHESLKQLGHKSNENDHDLDSFELDEIEPSFNSAVPIASSTNTSISKNLVLNNSVN